jgi:methyl-accepting chemotaxis protein
VSAAGDSILRLQENFEDMRQFYKIRFSVITKYNEDLLQEIAEVLGHIQYQDVVSQCIQRIRVATAQRNAFFENAVQQYGQDDAEVAQLPPQLLAILNKFVSEEDKHLHSARHDDDAGSEQKIELF